MIKSLVVAAVVSLGLAGYAVGHAAARRIISPSFVVLKITWRRI
jgi:hypothetical protein